jgi:hypothetical protein
MGVIVDRAIAQANPDHLARWPVKNAEAVRILVPGYRSASAATRRAARFSSKSSLESCSGSRATHDPALPLGGERQAGVDVLTGKLRKVGEEAARFGPSKNPRVARILSGTLTRKTLAA